MSSKRIQKIKEQILEALEEETPYYKSIKSLVPAFYSLAIASVGINIMSENLKWKQKKKQKGIGES